MNMKMGLFLKHFGWFYAQQNTTRTQRLCQVVFSYSDLFLFYTAADFILKLLSANHEPRALPALYAQVVIISKSTIQLDFQPKQGSSNM